ncbi:hypothetical protein ND2E_4107 [Colwellia psychrerythraea]|uniref:Uncharacterized protein n=1 Tax=Colwellia psychrerythraea TaxID=28229 RepID=A0A099KF07_COLPS|nr:hypothetical protein ND2E_4107 [Colwellia psychrerythraea]
MSYAHMGLTNMTLRASAIHSQGFRKSESKKPVALATGFFK